ncbi:MAG: pyridoxamine 5'-phosphate oxidase family protein [Acidimicrobiia bacterium]|nr:pyridoxamine 5'-phosphate oxidase family protein [Acidimicrobiia bacterium]
MRSAQQRRADTIRRLETEPNVWLATASATGTPHLVPLSLAWDGARVLVATPTKSPTVQNAVATRAVKASLDSAEDVVLIEGTVEVLDYSSLDPELADRFVQRAGWSPADQEGEWSLLIVSPRTIRAWNSVTETTGRTIMRQGSWVDAAD